MATRSIYQTRTDDSIRQHLALEYALRPTDAEWEEMDRAYRHEMRVKSVKRYLRERAKRAVAR